MENARITNPPYDDVFRTLLNDCSSLIIPVINEVFKEHYSGQEKITFSPNEHFLNQQGGDEEKQITDTTFKQIKNNLEILLNQGIISEYTRCTIIDMSNRVLEHIAVKYTGH